MKAALVKVAEIIFKRKIWGLVGRVLLLVLAVATIVLVLMNDFFLSERFWGLFLMFTLGWLVNLGLVFVLMINGEKPEAPLAFHIATTMFFFFLCGLIIWNPDSVKYYIPDWLKGLMIADAIILQVIIFVDGFYLNKEGIRNQVVI